MTTHLVLSWVIRVRSWDHWYWCDSSTPAWPCLAVATCWTGSSLFLIAAACLPVMRGSMTMSLFCSVSYTGRVFQKEYITDWLQAVLVFRCHHNMAPPYLASDSCWINESETLQRLCSALANDWLCREQDFTLLVTVHSMLQRHGHGSLPASITAADSLTV